MLAATGRAVRGLAALTALLGLVAGAPLLLWLTNGSPIPGRWPDLHQLGAQLANPLDDATLLHAVAIVAWVAWLVLLRDIAVETIAALSDAAAARRGHPRPLRRPSGGPLRLVAAVLIGAIVGSLLIDATRGALRPPSTSATATATARPPAATASLTPAPVDTATDSNAARAALTAARRPAIITTTISTTTHASADAVPEWASDAPGGTYHVVKGDNLWDIAEAHLGSPYRWREIYVLNRGKPQANGYALRDPDEIHVGWILAMPATTPATAPGTTSPGAAPAHPTPTPAAAPAATAPVPTPPATTTPPAAPSTSPTPAPAPSPSPSPSPSPTASNPTGAVAASPTPAPTADTGASAPAAQPHHQAGMRLPSQGWISLGLAAAIATLGTVLRLQRRRRTRLRFPIPVTTDPQPSPVPDSLTPADLAGRRELHPDPDPDTPLPGLLPDPTSGTPAPIGLDPQGQEISLFTLPGPGLALTGPGAPGAARAIIAASLATGVLGLAATRPVVVTTAEILTNLLPPGALAVGLDPGHDMYEGERLIVLADTGNAVTHAEEELIHRRRILDSLDAATVTELNAREDHIEHLPPYLLVLPESPRHVARLDAVTAHRDALQLHTVILGHHPGMPAYQVDRDGAVTSGAGEAISPAEAGTLATLSAADLADALALIARAATRPEPGTDPDDPHETPETAPAAAPPEIPAPTGEKPPPVKLTVLGPVTLTTTTGPITTGVRSGSYAALALLAAHPTGRTLKDIAAAIYPDTEPAAAIKRARTDITSARTVLRTATGIDTKGAFITYTPDTDRYRLDPDLIEVDLWAMLTAINQANTADDEPTCLGHLQQAAALYQGDFAEGQDHTWVTDYATTHRHHILAVYARIAEILEPDHPDQAITALDTAIHLDPINEELYQRVIRIHGRQHRPDAVRRTLRLLENRLAELADAEPSEATRRIAERQLHPTPAKGPAQ